MVKKKNPSWEHIVRGVCVCVCACVVFEWLKQSQLILAFCQRNCFLELAPSFQQVQISGTHLKGSWAQDLLRVESTFVEYVCTYPVAENHQHVSTE